MAMRGAEHGWGCVGKGILQPVAMAVRRIAAIIPMHGLGHKAVVTKLHIVEAMHSDAVN